jgi:trigger factor
VKLGDLSAVEVERISAEVDEPAIDKTVEILRKQRRTFAQRPAAEGAEAGDRVTIDFEGKIDGTPFDGGKAEGFQFLVGEGQMLEQFDQAVRGMKVGDTKTVEIESENAYGPRREALVTQVSREAAQFPVEPQVGMHFGLPLQDGSQIEVVVTEVTETHVTIDGNHPLAGEKLIFDVELVGKSDE